jgi:hypothetical protein
MYTDIHNIYHYVTDKFVKGLQISFYLTYKKKNCEKRENRSLQHTNACWLGTGDIPLKQKKVGGKRGVIPY